MSASPLPRMPLRYRGWVEQSNRGRLSNNGYSDEDCDEMLMRTTAKTATTKMEVHGSPWISMANFNRRSKCLKSRKTAYYVFCIFTPLDRRFRLSHVSKTIDLDEIYRLVSKNLDFMAYGSVLSRFSVFNRF